ncbi:MAG: ParB/RepB/Spo0J family partition protein [Acidobacteriia bacterium]|nr:ParB/RepB/Spo0J family partition protein [Terriglobia bacterium]
MTRKALGRGLSALLRDVDASTSVGLESIPLDQIDPNPFQPRRAFPDSGLKELADSIRASGLVQPILVRRADNRFQLVVGERRWRAAKLAGIETIPAVIRDLGDREALELALTETLIREDLNPIETAHGLHALQEKHGLTHEEIAGRLGVNRSTVTNILRLLRLPEDVQALLVEGKITAGHARAILGLKSEAEQTKLARLVAEKGLSVRDAEEYAAWEPPPVALPTAEDQVDPNVRAAILQLERTLGTRVKILGTPQSGRIEIRYYSAEDLNRIFEWITRR